LSLFAALIAEGVTLIVVTHEPEVAAATRRLIEMRDGRIVQDRVLEKAA
jgi:predicted ABC-type transport system involved in lysophospholipase L1 biosynthesis ATPase subunit